MSQVSIINKETGEITTGETLEAAVAAAEAALLAEEDIEVSDLDVDRV